MFKYPDIFGPLFFNLRFIFYYQKAESVFLSKILCYPPRACNVVVLRRREQTPLGFGP